MGYGPDPWSFYSALFQEFRGGYDTGSFERIITESGEFLIAGSVCFNRHAPDKSCTKEMKTNMMAACHKQSKKIPDEFSY
jgi:hypothetical protein